MKVSIREWEIEDAPDLTVSINNQKLLDNLRDGISYPYTEKDAEEFISAMLASAKDSQYTFAITCDEKVIGSIGIFRKENIHHLTAEPYAHNTAFCRVLEKSGFQFEGLLKQNAIKNGQMIDMKMYSILKT